MIPRIQARIGMVEHPPEWKGKYCFEVFLTFPGEGEGKKMGEFGPFDSESEAKTHMRKVCRDMAELVEKKMTGKISGKYLDMKTNEFRSWDEN